MCALTAPTRVRLPNSLASGRLARRFVEDNWCPTHCGTDLGRVHLLVTELVVNAVEHGGPPILLELECTGGDVLLQVSDGGTTLPQPQDSPAHAEGGRGVYLINLLSRQWGIDHHHDVEQIDLRTTPSNTDSDPQTLLQHDGAAKTVWCRLVPV